MKKTKQSKLSLNLLGKIVTIVVILLLALISFVGIYVQDKNSIKNIIPTYELGMDIYGSRNIVIKVDDSVETKKYDSEGKLITDESSIEEGTELTQVEEPINPSEALTLENYKEVRDIIEKRLEYMKVSNYLIKFNETNGTISVEVPENSNTDYIAQYMITNGEFKIIDDETEEVLLTNSDIKEAKVQYSTSTSGTTVYLTIQFNKEATEKLKNISNTYISTTDEEGNTSKKTISMTLDGTAIISTYFEEEIPDGLIQLSIGTSSNTETLQTYLQQASNIAIFLNTNPMPLTYTMEVNRFVYSDITQATITTIIIVLVIIAVLMAIYMIIKFKQNGMMGVIANIGFTAILLLAVRFGNVLITLTGIFAIAISVIIEYLITILLLEEYKKDQEIGTTSKNIKSLLGKTVVTIIPLLVLAITFALINWEEIASIGMVLFWAILIMLIYNAIILAIKIYTPNKKQKKEKSNPDKNK